MAVAIVAGALANKPDNGGEAWVRLSWVLGLRRLGFDVHFIERLPTGDPAGRRFFEQVVGDFGLTERASLLGEGGEALFGRGKTELVEVADEADVLFDISGHLGQGAVLAAAESRVYVDLDPGFAQAWHADPNVDFSLAGYDRYLTVGQNIGKPNCPVPTEGIEWVPTLPPILLEEWEPAPRPPGRPRFTTVATWRSPSGSLVIGGREMSLKHQQFRRFVELPRRVPDTDFEIALAIHAGDATDLELLRENGWRIVDPVAVAATPAAFRDYVRGSGAEFSVAQGVYVEARTGWFSDRTAAYLASGRPALVQNTGWRTPSETDGSESRPGSVSFDDVEGAVAGVETIAENWEERSRAARAFAEQHLDSDRVLGRVLELVLLWLILLVLPSIAVSSARGASIQVAGRPQTVFDWSREACSPAESPDLPARVFRDDRGRVQLLISNQENYRLIGPSLGRLRPDCHPVMGSSEDGRPSAFADMEWIGSVFTRNGRTIWALVHDEYQGNLYPSRCPSGSYYRCWYNAVTLARSTDGGRTYEPARVEPNQLVAGPSFRYRSGVGSRGVFGPSNIVVGPDRANYSLVRVRDLAGQRGVCLIRTRRISSPGSWRAWDGRGFGARFRDPYRSAPQRRAACRLLDPGRIAEMTESLTYSEALNRYLLVGLAPPGPLSVGRKARGIYFSTSTDLVHWEPRKLIAPAVTKQNYRCGGAAPIAYPSVIDPGSRSRTYATSGSHPFLYYTQFRYRNCHQTEERDLMRVRLTVAP